MRMLVVIISLLAPSVHTTPLAIKSEREHQKLLGRVKRIIVEESRLSKKPDIWVESKRKIERIFDYDNAGNLTKQVDYTGMPAVSTTTYRYDAAGNRTDSVYVQGGPAFRRRSEGIQNDISDGRLVRWRFKYDKENNRVEEAAYSKTAYGPESGEILIDRYVHTYDHRANRVSTAHYDPTVLGNKIVYDYDDTGNLTGLARYSAGDYLELKELYTDEFDSIANWIKRTTSTEKRDRSKPYIKPEKVTYRTITYY